MAGDRKAWLFFCTGVEHAYHVAKVLEDRGIASACVTGKTPKKEREKILADFKARRLRALTNANVLTTGFDYPDIDLIAMMRPTLSPSLYVQMAGRGMRPKSHTDHCMVLDFAGVVSTHGPITAVQPPKTNKKSDEPGEAPVKACPECHELVHPSAKECPSCGYEFPITQKKLKLHDDDIMGLDGSEMEVTEWKWRKHISRASGKEMLAVSYYGGLSDPAIIEYFPVTHDGYAGQKALQTVFAMSRSAGINVVDLPPYTDLDEVSNILNVGVRPHTIEYKKDGKFFRVLKRSWT